MTSDVKAAMNLPQGSEDRRCGYNGMPISNEAAGAARIGFVTRYRSDHTARRTGTALSQRTLLVVERVGERLHVDAEALQTPTQHRPLFFQELVALAAQ